MLTRNIRQSNITQIISDLEPQVSRIFLISMVFFGTSTMLVPRILNQLYMRLLIKLRQSNSSQIINVLDHHFKIKCSECQYFTIYIYIYIYILFGHQNAVMLHIWPSCILCQIICDIFKTLAKTIYTDCKFNNCNFLKYSPQ